MALKPNSKAWLDALAKQNPTQASVTSALIEAAGHEEVCSICGAEPSAEYRKMGSTADVDSFRLCADCRASRERQGKHFEPLE
jgi:hypothetical protein